MSPTGSLAIALALNGSSAAPKGAWFASPNSIVDVLATEGGNVRKVGTAKAGQLAEGIAFSPDGGYLYVADFIDSALRVYKVEGTGVRDTQQGPEAAGAPRLHAWQHSLNVVE